MKKYRCIQPFIAFGKTPDVGEIVELTTEQAEALRGMESIAPYEVKVVRPPKEIKKKPPVKSSGSAPVARQSKKKTYKRSKKTAKK